MKNILLVCVLMMFIFSTQTMAQSAPPSQESLKKLLQLIDGKALINQSYAQINQALDMAIKEELNGQTATPEQQKITNTFKLKVVAIMQEDLNWDVMEPHIVEIYGQTLTQQEVDGMIAFYQSSAGQSILKKMPLIMQKSMIMMQKMMPPMMKKIIPVVEEMKKELENTKKQEAAK